MTATKFKVGETVRVVCYFIDEKLLAPNDSKFPEKLKNKEFTIIGIAGIDNIMDGTHQLYKIKSNDYITEIYEFEIVKAKVENWKDEMEADKNVKID